MVTEFLSQQGRCTTTVVVKLSNRKIKNRSQVCNPQAAEILWYFVVSHMLANSSLHNGMTKKMEMKKLKDCFWFSGMLLPNFLTNGKLLSKNFSY